MVVHLGLEGEGRGQPSVLQHVAAVWGVAGVYSVLLALYWDCAHWAVCRGKPFSFCSLSLEYYMFQMVDQNFLQKKWHFFRYNSSHHGLCNTRTEGGCI